MPKITKEQAIKILHPDTSAVALAMYTPEQTIEVVNEACRLAVEALRFQIEAERSTGR